MKTKLSILLLLILFLFLFTGCKKTNNPLDPNKPITITMWHNYGGTMQQTMDGLIDEFNSTLGKEKGIIINVSAITSSSELQETMRLIANGEPGAPALPHISTSYPKTAILFQEKGMLANLDTYFSKEELSDYLPSFIEEGRFGDNGLYVFPIAKSTEILYLNQTLFDEFAAENDVPSNCFETFEGIVQVAMAYYQWTDAKTPTIPNDGKAFFTADSWFNLAQTGMQQKGESLFDKEELSLRQEAYQQIFQTLYPGFLSGGIALYDGYSSDLAKTGDLVCSTGSSAGILFYGDTITLPDGRIRTAEYRILPFPTFDGGDKVVIQRGSGMMVTKSDKAHEYASAEFLRWFTSPEQNMRFISSTGYLPVTKDAFENKMKTAIPEIEDLRIKKMLTAVSDMYDSYRFFVAPAFEGFDEISMSYENHWKSFLKKERENAAAKEDPKDNEEQSYEAFLRFLSQ